MKDLFNETIKNENVDDIFFRNATITLLDLLNREVNIDLKRDGRVEKFSIPFFFNFASDEGFMKDFFMNLPEECRYPIKAEGNYDQLPRGIVTLNNFMIKNSDFTNKFVRGSFNQEVRDINDQKKLLAFSARLFVIPLSIKYSIKIESDNLNKTFKIIEKIFDFYYKNQVRYFQFRGLRIPAQIIFQESSEFQKNYNFTYSDSKSINISMNVDMETYFPSFDDKSTFYKGTTIGQFSINERHFGSNHLIDESWIDMDYPPKE